MNELKVLHAFVDVADKLNWSLLYSKFTRETEAVMKMAGLMNKTARTR